MRITSDVVLGYLSCKRKAYLAICGETGSPNDYQRMVQESVEAFRTLTVTRLLREMPTLQLKYGGPLRFDDFSEAPEIIVDATVAHSPFEVSFDALLKTEGLSSLGEFHYRPAVFNPEDTVHEKDKLFLAVTGFLLGEVQGCQPHTGIVISGREFRKTTVRISQYDQRVRIIIDDLQAMAAEKMQPAVMLSKNCPFCEFQSRCVTEAVSNDDLSLLRGMSEKDIKRNHARGIFTVTQLSYTFRPRKKGHRVKAASPYQHSLQALALREKKVYVFQNPHMPDARTRVYVDLEGAFNAKSVYLAGMLVCQEGVEEAYSFWVNDVQREREIFDQIADVLRGLNEPYVFHYGDYERRFFTRMLAATPNIDMANVLRDRTINVLSLIYSNIYFPVYSNSLKEIAAFVGCSWSEPAPSGLRSIVWRNAWEKTGNSGVKDRLVEYNREDCLALRAVTDLLYEIASGDAAAKRSVSSSLAGSVTDVPVDEIGGRYSFGNMNAVVSDFRTIIECAYFDYQRDRVFLRTNESVRRARRLERRHADVRFRVGKTIEKTAKKCPYCGGSDIVRDKAKFHQKRQLDLSVSPGGIKRRIVMIRTAFHRCLRCKVGFVPPTYKEEPRMGHALMAWTIYEHVANLMSLRSIVATARECYGLPIRFPKLFSLKKTGATYYHRTYTGLLKRIVSGEVIHIDETSVTLKRETGYVWVLTNMNEAVFIYRNSRNADFLVELLRDFRGVLVSDFYTAYDSLPCPQQKCIVHLIRDINTALLKNPFDNQLRSFAQAFGALMRGIIETLDQHGLRKKHMKKHTEQVNRFFSEHANTRFTSDLAEGFWKRVVKYRKKLFLFLEYDGVPWNNNNAEHAVKYFARYRRNVDGQIEEGGLRDYLVLLSVYVSCEYKGVRFLEFLLSKKRDIDEFAGGP